MYVTQVQPVYLNLEVCAKFDCVMVGRSTVVYLGDVGIQKTIQFCPGSFSAAHVSTGHNDRHSGRTRLESAELSTCFLIW